MAWFFRICVSESFNRCRRTWQTLSQKRSRVCSKREAINCREAGLIEEREGKALGMVTIKSAIFLREGEGEAVMKATAALYLTAYFTIFMTPLVFPEPEAATRRSPFPMAGVTVSPTT